MSKPQASLFEAEHGSSTGLPDWESPIGQKSLENVIDDLSGIDGRPKGDLETLLALSLPPYYVAAPNPYLRDVLDGVVSADAEEVTALASDVAAGKNDPLYFAHYYATKVPPDAIVPHIAHYTRPGDLVFDGFCGTGMTGVAAQLCSDAARVQGYGEVGPRRAVLVDLSPAATFIAAGTNAIARLVPYLDAVEEIVGKIEAQFAECLQTRHSGWPRGTSEPSLRKNSDFETHIWGSIEYVVWSDVFACSACGTEIIWWDLVFQGPKKPVPKQAPCPNCGSLQSLSSLDRLWTTEYDHEMGAAVEQAKQVPVLINYRVGKKRFEKTPDTEDLAILDQLRQTPLLASPPLLKMPPGINTDQPRKSHGFTHAHHFYTRRNLTLLSEFWRQISDIDNRLLRTAALFVLTGSIQRVCRLNRYMPNHDRHVGPLSGTLYVAPLTAEIPATNYFRSRLADLRRLASGPTGHGIYISTQSATTLANIPDGVVDYIFTDPPFGGNLNYSELNSLIDMWLEVRTDAEPEAVVNSVQGKALAQYQYLMTESFSEFYRILKPNKWITVEFHNSSNAVWIAIQEALLKAGFIVADVRTLDKKKGTTKQLSYAATVKQDLIISAYRPSTKTENTVKDASPSEDSCWTFVAEHLEQLPVCVVKAGRIDVIAERQPHLLFDRMVAFHVQRGRAVPISSSEFYIGLAERFPERDEMYFLPEHVAEYDKKRKKAQELRQFELFVSDEASAIQWVRQKLHSKPITFQDLQPGFMMELQAWSKHEHTVELRDILEQNFLLYDGAGPVPNQIHSYLSSNFKDLRNLAKDDAQLKAKAKDRWYVPDPGKQTDLEKLREKALLKEFEEYRESTKKLKQFRTEAVRAGFKACYDEGDYKTIVAVAERLPESVLQEDEKLLMYYDVASMRLGDT